MTVARVWKSSGLLRSWGFSACVEVLLVISTWTIEKQCIAYIGHFLRGHPAKGCGTRYGRVKKNVKEMQKDFEERRDRVTQIAR